MRKSCGIRIFETGDVQFVHARERRTGKVGDLRLVLDDSLIEEAHALPCAHKVADDLEAADADIGAEGIGRIAALLELAL